MNTTKAKDKIYVGDLTYLPEVCADEHFKDNIELVEITLREEVVYDVDLTVRDKVKLAQALDAMNVPVLQMHSQGAADVIKACRDAGVKAKFEVLSRPYNSYGFKDWQSEIMEGIKGGADRIRPSITTPRKWKMGDPSMSLEAIARRTMEDVKFALDNGAKEVVIGFTDSPRMDLLYLHIMRTITQDESIQFPFSPSLVGQKFQVGMGRGSGVVGVKEKMRLLGISVPEERVPAIVTAVNQDAIKRKRRLTDDEFRALVATMS